MKKNIILTSILCLGCLYSFAWGYRGHKLIGSVARTLLSPAVRDSVQHYLGDKSFEDASVWMDDVRSDATYDYLKPMHYINVEKDKTYVKVSEPNIINELDTVFEELQHRSSTKADVTKTNLLILFHLVEDLHQPLHAGYADDKGGNAVQVDFLGAKSNLHKVWDTNIIESQNISEEDCLSYINGLSEKEKKNIGELNFVHWMEDSRKLLPEVYALNNGAIDQAYVTRNVPVVKKQLAYAAIRLASALTHLFNNGTNAKRMTATKQG